MGVKFDVIEVVESPIDQKKVFVIKTPESGLLIGDEGETFYALTHLIRRIAGKGMEVPPDFSLDVNDYRSGMIEKLKIKAVMLANRARDMKANIELDPMSSYERLIIHGALNDQPNIKTESMGEGRERRVIIKYIGS